jgi:hypothetical protein
MVILRATSILGGQNEDKEMMCSIPLNILSYLLKILNNKILYVQFNTIKKKLQ